MCSADCAAAYLQDIPKLVPVREQDLIEVVPDALKREDPDFARRIRDQFADAMPVGLAPSVHRVVLDAIGHLLRFLQSVAQNGDFGTFAVQLEHVARGQLRGRQEVPYVAPATIDTN